MFVFCIITKFLLRFSSTTIFEFSTLHFVYILSIEYSICYFTKEKKLKQRKHNILCKENDVVYNLNLMIYGFFFFLFFSSISRSLKKTHVKMEIFTFRKPKNMFANKKWSSSEFLIIFKPLCSTIDQCDTFDGMNDGEQW